MNLQVSSKGRVLIEIYMSILFSCFSYGPDVFEDAALLGISKNSLHSIKLESILRREKKISFDLVRIC
jgi:hypothetical protein